MQKLSLMLAAVALLAACSNNDSDYAPPAPPPSADPPVMGSQVPTSATQSSLAATSFVRSTAAADTESAEGLELGEAMLAASDTEEPAE